MRASVRAASGDVSAAASAGVKRRTAEGLVVAPKEIAAKLGQMIRMAVAAGASMVMVSPSPA